MSSLVVRESCSDLKDAPSLVPKPRIASAVVATCHAIADVNHTICELLCASP